MKALQCVELGGVDKLEINEVSSPDVGPGQVLICLLYTSDAADE